MKLLETFKKQIGEMGELKRVWLTTFNLDIAFVETWVLPAVLGLEPPVSRMDYEGLQRALTESGLDFRIYCDPRMVAKDKPKRTSIAVYPVSVRKLAKGDSPYVRYLEPERSLFHPKVFYFEDHNKKVVIGAGSANLTLSGWGRNREAVDFRSISSNQQYQQVKQFFTRIDESLNSEDFFPVRRKFSGDDHGWSFIHSLGGLTLLKALENDGELKTLSIWSPYLAEDMVGFIAKFAGPELRVELVPDLVAGCYVRTRWDDKLQALLNDGKLTFFHPPVLRGERELMTHAKLWLAKSTTGCRMAVGSWNFTAPGCSSLEEPGWNVEAGIVHVAPRSATLCIKEWVVDESDFASKELLEEEALDPGELPPFDLTVIFDWTRCEYRIAGKWFRGKPESGYQLILPGIAGPSELIWKANGDGLKSPSQLVVRKSDRMLDNAFYSLRRAGKMNWQGIIIETGTEHRRALSFTSLDDLLNSYLSTMDPRTSDCLTLRGVGARDEMQSEGEVKIAALEATSYFRLFQATQQRRNWLAEVEDGSQLYRRLFSEPGSLLELAEIAQERVEQAPGAVFNWFLAQEVNSLTALARKRVKSLRRKHGAEAISVAAHRWEPLQIVIPTLSGDSASQRYISAIRETCDYGK